MFDQLINYHNMIYLPQSVANNLLSWLLIKVFFQGLLCTCDKAMEHLVKRFKSYGLYSKQKDEKRAAAVMNTLDKYAETLAKALKYIEEKNKFEAENIGNTYKLPLNYFVLQ